MTKTKNAKGAGRPSEIEGAVLIRAYISEANRQYLLQDGPRQMSARLRRVLEAAADGLLDNAARTEALLVVLKQTRESHAADVERLQAQVARLEQELSKANFELEEQVNHE